MKDKKVTDLLALLVFTAFALCLLGVLLTGAGSYRRLVRQGDQQFRTRTALQYLATHVRQAEAVCVEEFGDGEALVCRETIDGADYVTKIYYRDGWLWELFCAGDAPLDPEDGERVLEAEEVRFSLEGDRLTVRTGESELCLLLRSGREVP